MIYVVNVVRIKEKMYGRGYNKSTLSRELEISRNTLATYLSEPEKMPFSVVSKMATLLCDSKEEAAEIFFAPQLS